MERPQTFLRVYYLNALRDASPTDRKHVIENITPGQMNANVGVIYHLVNGLIPVLIVDRRYFRRTRLNLRQLAASRPPFNVKKGVLLHNRSLIPRLLRIFLFEQHNSFHSPVQ